MQHTCLRNRLLLSAHTDSTHYLPLRLPESAPPIVSPDLVSPYLVQAVSLAVQRKRLVVLPQGGLLRLACMPSLLVKVQGGICQRLGPCPRQCLHNGLQPQQRRLGGDMAQPACRQVCRLQCHWLLLSWLP